MNIDLVNTNLTDLPSPLKEVFPNPHRGQMTSVLKLAFYILMHMELTTSYFASLVYYENGSLKYEIFHLLKGE